MGESIQLSNGLPSCIRAGEVLGSKYRLERELGRGAMGTVWAAMHLSLGQRVAIKLIAAEHAQSDEARIRFRTEAQAAARLKSRHVVQVYDDGETPEGTPFIVMEFLEGESLEARLEREASIPLVDAVRITGQVARALARAHAQGIIHRDLKPGNIFLARSDEDELGWLAKVLDFGIAKVEEHREHSTTKTGTVLGTPLFMSPEQVRGASNVDQRADLYSLGMCFYNMITGKFGFDGESFGDILVSICTEPLPDIQVAAPWVSDEVAAWFQRCCARDPANRFQSADELLEALQSAVGATIQSVNRRSAPEEQLGPSGTLKGHSPPVSPNTRAVGEDSGEFAARSESATDPVATLRDQPGVNSESTSVLTVREFPVPRSVLGKRSRWFAAAAILLALGGAASSLRSGSGQQTVEPGAESPPATLAAPSAVIPEIHATKVAQNPAPLPAPSAAEPAPAAASTPSASAPERASTSTDEKLAEAGALTKAAPRAVAPKKSRAASRTAAEKSPKPAATAIDIGF